MTEEVGGLEKRVELIEQELVSVRSLAVDVGGIKARVEGVERRLGQVDEKVTELLLKSRNGGSGNTKVVSQLIELVKLLAFAALGVGSGRYLFGG